MQTNETLDAGSVKLTGKLFVTLRNAAGETIAEQHVPNLVVTAGKAFIASRMAGAASNVMSHMAVGSNNTAESTAQTALLAQTAIVALTVAGGTPSSNQVTYTATFGAGVGTGTIAEAGIFNAASAGTMLARSIAVSLTKGATDTLTITWVVTVG